MQYDFGNRLTYAMKLRKKSQEDLAKALGGKRQTISSYQRGINKPSAEVVYEIAKFLDVSADFLLGLSDIEALDPKVRAAASLTGLSTKSVETLVDMKNSSAQYIEIYPETTTTLQALNFILEDINTKGERALEEAKQDKIIQELMPAEMYKICEREVNILPYLYDYCEGIQKGMQFLDQDGNPYEIQDVLINGKHGNVDISDFVKAALRQWVIDELDALSERNKDQFNTYKVEMKEVK